MSEIVEELEKRYPNDIMVLKGKTPEEIAVYIAQLELIAEIKVIEELGVK